MRWSVDTGPLMVLYATTITGKITNIQWRSFTLTACEDFSDKPASDSINKPRYVGRDNHSPISESNVEKLGTIIPASHC